jgi:uncharacterized protein (TIGR02145 family)
VKKFINSSKRIIHGWFEVWLAFLTCLMFLLVPSCQKNELYQDSLLNIDSKVSSALPVISSTILYYGPVIFTESVVETRTIEVPYYENFEKPWVLKVQNGNSLIPKVSTLDISIQGQKLIKSADFKKLNLVEKKLTSLSNPASLEITIVGNPGSYVEIWIEGTPVQGKISDADRNVYKTVKIGTQVWMAENLKTTRYRDKTPITNVIDNTEWSSLTSGGYCWYGNDASTYKATYGALYNWYSVGTGKLCPNGWHVPTDTEWKTLENYMVANGYNYDGTTMYNMIAKSMASNTTDWLQSDESGAVGNNLKLNNRSGFTALPGGSRSGGEFLELGATSIWWSSTEHSQANAWGRYLLYASNGENWTYTSKNQGLSVRCLEGEGQVQLLPVLTTTPVTGITSTLAESGGNISSDGGTAVSARGVCWSTLVNPTIADSKTSDGTGTGLFTSSITGLTAGETYYVKAYATNSAGTAYGDEQQFTASSAGPTITDADGNVYNTVIIGTQVWITENLKTTKYSDGTAIPTVTDGNGSGTTNDEWAFLSTPAFCWYNNDAATYKDTYGALYNWYAVDAAGNVGKSLCPTGWHVPTDAEWTTLTTYLGGESVAGGKLKETLTTHWLSSNEGATNESGFTALPGGYRNYTGTYDEIGLWGNWWSSTGYSYTPGAYCRFISTYSNSIGRNYYSKQPGFSVRCLQD